MCCILRNTWQNFDPRLKLPSPPNRLPENRCFLCVGWGLSSGLVMAKRKDLCGLSSGRSTHGVLCQWWSMWFIKRLDEEKPLDVLCVWVNHMFIKCIDATGCFVAGVKQEIFSCVLLTQCFVVKRCPFVWFNQVYRQYTAPYSDWNINFLSTWQAYCDTPNKFSFSQDLSE